MDDERGPTQGMDAGTLDMARPDLMSMDAEILDMDEPKDQARDKDMGALVDDQGASHEDAGSGGQDGGSPGEDMIAIHDEELIAMNAMLPGPRAALSHEGALWLLLAEGNQTSLRLVELDPTNHSIVRSLPIANDLNWRSSDQTEQAALFVHDKNHLHVVFEDHSTSDKVRLRYARVHIKAFMTKDYSLIQELSRSDEPRVDFDSMKDLVLVNRKDKVEFYTRKGGDWDEDYPVDLGDPPQLLDPFFVEDDYALCGHRHRSLVCYGWDVNEEDWVKSAKGAHQQVRELRAVLMGEHIAFTRQDQPRSIFHGAASREGSDVSLMILERALSREPTQLAIASQGGRAAASYTSAGAIYFTDDLAQSHEELLDQDAERSALISHDGALHVFTSHLSTARQVSSFKR